MALTDKLTAIGDAIRAKNGTTEAMTLDQMATAITNLPSGGSGSSGTWKSVSVPPTKNGVTSTFDLSAYLNENNDKNFFFLFKCNTSYTGSSAYHLVVFNPLFKEMVNGTADMYFINAAANLGDTATSTYPTLSSAFVTYPGKSSSYQTVSFENYIFTVANSTSGTTTTNGGVLYYLET